MLLNNYSYDNNINICGHTHSGKTSPFSFIGPLVMRGYFTRCQTEETQGVLDKDSFPSGAQPPAAYLLGDKGALLSSTTLINGTGTLTGSIAQGINIAATINGTSSLSANASLIVSLASTIAGTGNISAASLVGTVGLAATLAGTGNVTAGLNVIAFMNAVCAGSGGVTANLTGTASLAAHIYVNESEATVSQLVEGVWNALLADYNLPNTMGEVMNNMGSVADPWATALPGSYAPGEAGYILGNLLANIPDSVWDELKTSHTTASSYGKIVQDLETLAKQIKALTAANL